MKLARHGIEAELPGGWEGRIYRRASSNPAEARETFPILHAANFPLPIEDGDYGSGAVSSMGPDGVFAAVLEFGPAYVGEPTFPRLARIPRVRASDLGRRTMQVLIPGHLGEQRFFTLAGRAFCLYVVVGSERAAREHLAGLDRWLGSVRVARGAGAHGGRAR